MSASMATVRCLLRTRFGLEEVQPGQREIFRHLLPGRDVLGVLPTKRRQIADLQPGRDAVAAVLPKHTRVQPMPLTHTTLLVVGYVAIFPSI